MTAAKFEDNSPSHPYSLVRDLGNGLAFVSGVLPYDEAGNIVQDQRSAVEAVLDVLEQRLAEAGFDLSSVVKTTVFLTDLAWRDAVNEVFYDAFAPPMPARSAVQVVALPRGAAIELEAVLYRAS
jgi:2-iminobutanoate/2-iminopropanoate deaminase